jgi:hypothetical protein
VGGRNSCPAIYLHRGGRHVVLAMNTATSLHPGDPPGERARHPDDSAPLMLRTADDLHALKKSRLLYSKRPLVICIPGLSTDEAEALCSRLDRHRRDCGCSLGAKSMVLGVLVALAWLWFSYGTMTAAFCWRLPLLIPIGLGCAGIGKAIGLSVARRRLARDLEILPVKSFPDPGGGTINAR